MRKLIRSSFIIYLTTASFSWCFGQNEIALKKTPKGGEVKEIVFKQKSSGSVVKTINLDEINPYKNGYISKKSNPNISVAKENVTANVSKPNTNAAVVFNYIPQTEDYTLIAEQCEATVMAFDNSGNELLRASIDGYDFSRAMLTEDGKYLGIAYGGLVPEGGGESMPVGFKIYDLLGNNVWYELQVPEVMAGESENLLIFTVRIPNSGGSVEVYVFNSESHTLYKKRFSQTEVGLIKRYEMDGVVMHLLPQGERKEAYNTNFKTVKN